MAGDDPTVGVYLPFNEPSRLLLLVPANLSAGTYELRVTTQFTAANKVLKQPRTAVLPVNVQIV